MLSPTGKIILGAFVLCWISVIAFGCSELHFVSDSPTIFYDSGNDKFDVTFQFEHGNPGGGTYECFLRDSERCPPVINTTVCNEGDTVTFTGLDLGVWYTCGIRCTFGGIKRSISRSFGTPSSSIDCIVNLINDGISYVDHTDDGNATTCFMWSSSFLRLFGFECSIDNEDAVACTSPYCRVLTPDQHTIRITPIGCPGEAIALRRRFEVPADGCVLPFSTT